MPSLWPSLPPGLLLLLPILTSATLDCSHVRVDDQPFNFKSLGGPKTVHEVLWERPSIQNTTFTIDICAPLEREKDSKSEDACPSGTRVCGKEYDYHSGGNGEGFLKRVIPIAGEYKATHGRTLDPTFTRLKSQGDGKQEGVKIELHGGKYPDERSGTAQKAVVEFVCDKEMTGLEGFGEDSKMLDASAYGDMRAREEDDGDNAPDLPDLDEGKALKFVSYKKEEDVEVLRLRWRTSHACEGEADKPGSDDGGSSGGGDGKKGGSWGFFTWFLIIVFLLTATYIIFGSWLNYNRYGARGWDLIPHGDTIRDVPYIVKDWGTNVAQRFRGESSRGGYSAV